MKKTLLYILIITLSGVLLNACQDEDLSDLSYVFYVRRNGADMPAYVYGNGTERIFLIVLHGGPGGSGLQYRFGKFSEELEKRYAVVYWDQRGQGMAQGSYSKDDVTVEEMVKDVRALGLVLKEKFGQDSRLFLMGHSWGGTLGSSVMVTEDYQHMFNGWIEVDGAHDLPATYRGSINQLLEIGESQIREGNDRRFWRQVVDKVEDLDPYDVDFSYVNTKAYEGEEKLQNAGIIADTDQTNSFSSTIRYIMEDNPVTGWVSGLFTGSQLSDHGLDHYSVTDELYRIEIPTLLLWGRYDIVVSPDLGREAYDRISSEDKTLVIFGKSGHSPMATEPEAFLDEVIAFIERNK